jgi:hypothetical protein
MALPKLPSPPRSTGNEELDRWALALFQYVKALAPAEDGGSDLSSTQLASLTGGGASTLHYHAADRARANHTGTQPSSTISDLSSFVLGLISSMGTNHSNLSGLGWTASGHTGTASTLAGFSGAGAASEYAIPLTVANGGSGRATGTTAYGLLAAGTTAIGAHQTLAAGATTEILVGGGASALPVWTAATGSGAPVRANTPTLITPVLGVASATSLTSTDFFIAGGAGLYGMSLKSISGFDATTAIYSNSAYSGACVALGSYDGATFTSYLTVATNTPAITLNAPLTAKGNVTLGDASGDTLTIAPNAVTWSNNPTHTGAHTFSGGLKVSGTTVSGEGIHAFYGSNTGTITAQSAGVAYKDLKLEGLSVAIKISGTDKLTVDSSGNTSVAGTLTAADDVILSSSEPIRRSVDSSFLLLQGGSTAADGGQLVLYGNSNGSFPGQFKLSAIDSTGAVLTGTPGGSLAWSGASVDFSTAAVTTENLTANGNTVLGSGSGDTLTIHPNAVTWQNAPTHSNNHTFSGNITAANVLSGTYTPTLTETTNIGSSTSAVCQYMRVGSVVTVSGRVTVDATSAGSQCQLKVTLPIASNFASAGQLAGTCRQAGAAGTGGGAGWVVGNAVGDVADCFFDATSTSAQDLHFIFSYLVI